MESQVSGRQKILFVITKGNWGGAQRYVYDLATSLSPQEFEVHVAFGQRGQLAEKLQNTGVTLHDLHSLQRDVSFSADLQSFFEMRRLFKHLQPDIVHLNSSKAGGVGALAARTAGVKKIIFTAHGWPFWEDRSTLARTAIWLLSWLTALLSHAVIVISNYDMGVAQRMPLVRNKVTRIYNGIAPLQLQSGDLIRNAFPTQARIVGTIGELTKNKNQKALVEQARQDPALYVAIVGEGEERKNLEHLIEQYHLQDRVKLFGFKPAGEVLKGFDVFALPSIKEGLPYVVIEARHAGLPIEANRVGGVNEALEKDLSEFTLGNMVEKTSTLYRS